MTAVDSSPGRAHASPDCQGASPGPLSGLLGAGQSPVWACSWGPLLRPCLLHSTEAAGVRCRRAENHGLALSQSFPSTLATLSVLYHSRTALMSFYPFGQTIGAPYFTVWKHLLNRNILTRFRIRLLGLQSKTFLTT